MEAFKTFRIDACQSLVTDVQIKNYNGKKPEDAFREANNS